MKGNQKRERKQKRILGDQKRMNVWIISAVIGCILIFPPLLGAEYRKAPERGLVTPPPGGPTLILPPPDLTVSAGYLVFPCSIEGKYSRLEITAWVRNEGKGPAKADHGIAVTAYPSVTLKVDKKYGLIPVVHGNKFLNPGESFSIKLDLIIGPSYNDKDYMAVIQVDPQNAVKETSEHNNISTINIPALTEYCTKSK